MQPAESTAGQTGAKSCPCDNLKYGPPDANAVQGFGLRPKR